MPEQTTPTVLEDTAVPINAGEAAQRRQRIIPIDQTRSVQTTRDQKRSELIDLVESQKADACCQGCTGTRAKQRCKLCLCRRVSRLV